MTVQDKKVKTTQEKDDRYKRQKKRQILTNFSAICFVWLFEFTAYSGLQNLQAAINADTGLYSLTAITVGGVISCLVAPTLISYVGSKGALVLSCVCVCIYVTANYYPEPYILITAGGIIGLSTGMMWTAQSCYVTDMCMEYHKLTGEAFDAILSKLFGVFFVAFQSSQVWGNLISSVVFQTDTSTTDQTNTTACGADFCPRDQTTGDGNETINVIRSPEHKLEIILISIYLGCSLIGLLIVIFLLKPIKSAMEDKYATFQQRLSSNGRILCTDLNMALLVPFGLFVGIEQTVMFAQFTNVSNSQKQGYITTSIQ
jgi:MFS family permease